MPGLEGTTLGHYHLLGRLGRGGMSEVYLAYDDQLGRNVALKVVSSSHTDYLERFRREADAIRRLHHDHILPAFGYADQEPWHYLVMPFVEHGTLRDILDIGPVSLQHANELLQQIAGALQAAHDNGIIHRDIKPSNILMRDKHYIYLADFGLAKELEGANSITQTGALLGTPEYMAPDLADGPATTSSDIYALGVMLYQMVTGRVPFTGETPVSVYMKHLREQPIPPSFYNSKLPRSVDQVILRALDKDPRRRFQTPQELADAFQRAITTPSVHDTQEMAVSALPTTSDLARIGNGDIPVPTTRRYGRQARQARQARQNRTPSSANRRFILPKDVKNVGSVTGVTPISTEKRFTPSASVSPIQTDPLPSAQKNETPNNISIAAPVTAQRNRPQKASSKRSNVQAKTFSTSSHKRHRSLLGFSIIVIGILLFIVLPMMLIYYNYITHSHTLPVTPSATTIATVTSTDVTTSSQAQNTPVISSTALAATSGTPIFADTLVRNTNSRWSEDSTFCLFTSNTYRVHVLQSDTTHSCALTSPQFTNASFEVDTSLLNGQSAGILFRATNGQFYDFEITSQDQFFLRRHDSVTGTTYVYLLPPTTSAAIVSSRDKNTLLVIANGSTIQLFINTVSVGTINDNTYSIGQIAFVCNTQAAQVSGEASFSNFKVFAIS